MNILDETVIEPACRSLVPSPHQEAIFQQIPQPEPLLIQAVAGSGKTTTLIEATQRAGGSNLFLAFNKSIAEDILRKGANGEVKTLNALGHGIVMRNRGGKLNARKVPEIVKQIMGDTAEHREYGYTISRLVGYAKNLCIGIDAPAAREEFETLVADSQQGSDIPLEHQELAAAVAFEAFERSRQDETCFDFDDQLWLPIAERWEFPSPSNVFCDEAQDLSPIQHAMLSQFTHSKLVAVGDRHQAIYGFRGALHDSMDALKSKFSMAELPLSVCYRCPAAVVREAQSYCPEIRYRADAPEGAVLIANSDPLLFPSNYMILCRNNAPLFRAILAKVRAQEPCQVLSSFLDTFHSFIKGFKTTYTSDLLSKAARWRYKEFEAAKTRSKQSLIQDKYETLCVLATDLQQTEDILRLLKKLQDSRRGPIFATIHKSKGLEYENVYLLRPDLLGAFATSPEQLQQEENLKYVAITRSQSTFTYGAG